MRRLIPLILLIALTACRGLPGTTSDPAEPLPTLPPTTPLPSQALIVFVREGGVGYTSTTIVVNTDGTARLEGSLIPMPIDWTVPADSLKTLNDQLNHAAFAALPYDPNTDLVCADCYVYTVNALTPQGVKSLMFDEADISVGQDTSPRYQELVTVMESIIASAPPPVDRPVPEAEALPGHVLLIYNRTGGFAFTDTTLTLTLNGEATLTDSASAQIKQWTIPAASLSALTELLADSDWAGQPFDQLVGCLDCYVYTLTARTSQGILMTRADDADFGAGQYALLQEAIGQLEQVKQSAP